MNPNAVTASRLKQLRENRGLSQEVFASEFSEFCGRSSVYSLMTVSNWETGRKLPPADTIIQLAQFYGASSDYIFGLSNDETLLSTSDKVVSINQRIEVPFKDLAMHDGEALYIKFPDNKIKSQMGLLDYPNRQIVTINYRLNIDSRCHYYICVPPEELTIRSQMTHLLNLKDVLALDLVYIQSLSPDPYIQGLVSGWYKHFVVDGKKKFLIDDQGNTLSYEGLSVTYNAIDTKAPTKKAGAKNKL